VLDLSRVLAGPFATMVLADLGADVLKVERPGTGDDTRTWGPPFHSSGDAAYFLSVNRNRRSVALDLTSPSSLAVVSTLVAHADVVIENFLPQHLQRLGLDEVRQRCPQTVWVSIRGAGSDGPDGLRPGYDVMVQARSGLMGVTGFPKTGPTKVGVAIADVVTGLYAAVAALSGVVARSGAVTPPEAVTPSEARSGGAQADAGPGSRASHIEVPLLESAISALVNQAANHLIGGLDPRPLGNDHPNIAPYGPVACADRPLVVGAGNDRQFVALCTTIGVPELAADARFAANADRVAHREELRVALEQTFVTRRAVDWQVELEGAGVPCAPVNSVAEALADPHVAEVGLVEEVDHPDGPIRLVGSPLLVDGARPAVRRPPPLLGQHTEEVLRSLGLEPGTIAALRAKGDR
jgi:crotonobetainyl-CoA:carnitine CoA-transferase CaiB-like acyl-CoA transferase